MSCGVCLPFHNEKVKFQVNLLETHIWQLFSRNPTGVRTGVRTSVRTIHNSVYTWGHKYILRERTIEGSLTGFTPRPQVAVGAGAEVPRQTGASVLTWRLTAHCHSQEKLY